MLCQNCGKNEANVKYTQIINGTKTEINVCDKCAIELGIDKIEMNMPIHFSDFLGEFFNDYDSNMFPTYIKKKELCNSCGEKYEEFIKTGLLGCSECYEDFSEKIDPVLKKLHGNTRHVGRRMNVKNNYNVKKVENVKENMDNNNLEESMKNKILQLQKDLKEAIKEERYEDAAKIRDEIKKLN